MNAPILRMQSNVLPLRQTARRHGVGRLRFFRAVERLAKGGGGRSFYRKMHLAERRFHVREERLKIPGLSRGLEGFTIVQISDLHGGSFLGAGDLKAVVAAVGVLAPDLCVITGDLITHHWTDALPLLEDLARLKAEHGVFACFGNHDYKDRLEDRIAEAYRSRGIRFLRDESVRIDTGVGAIALVGLEDLEESKQLDLDRARANIVAGDVEIVLCHNPRGARALARRGCAAILAGHTHGLQIDLPWLRNLGPKHPGSRLRIGATTLIVNRGLGVVGFPLRVRAPAEIVVVRLESIHA